MMMKWSIVTDGLSWAISYDYDLSAMFGQSVLYVLQWCQSQSNSIRSAGTDLREFVRDLCKILVLRKYVKQAETMHGWFANTCIPAFW